MNSEIVYLDNAASEPLRPEADLAYQKALSDLGGIVANPASAHAAGRAAAVVLEDARARIARCLGADPAEVIFTGGGTESIVLAIRGLAKAAQNRDNRCQKLLYSAVEHDAVKQAALSLSGFEVIEIAVDRQGVISHDSLLEQLAIKDQESRVGLVSLQLVNNENGVIQPVALAAQRIRDFFDKAGLPRPMIHCDAVAAAGHYPINFHALGVDALSVAAHKFGGFAGSGVLLLKRDAQMVSERSGGGQERKLRGGTQDVLLAAAMAAALETAVAQLESEQQRIASLGFKLVSAVKNIPGVEQVGALAPRIPGIMQFILQGCEAEALLLALDSRGICASAGSACHTGVTRPSAVLLAQGYSETEAVGSLRISLGPTNTEADIEKLIAVLPEVIEISRRFSSGVVARGKK